MKDLDFGRILGETEWKWTMGRQVLGGVRMPRVWVKATPRPLRVGTVGTGQDSLSPGDPENSDRALVHPSPKNPHVASHLVFYFGIYYAFLV